MGRAKEGGVLLLVGVGLPFPSPTRKGGGGRKEGERNKEKWAAPLVQFGPEGAARLLPFGLSRLFPYGPIRPIYSPANSRNSLVLRKIPESLGTFPKYEYSHPIY